LPPFGARYKIPLGASSANHEPTARAGAARQDAVEQLCKDYVERAKHEGVSPSLRPLTDPDLDPCRIFEQPRQAGVCPLPAALDPAREPAHRISRAAPFPALREF